MSDRKSSVWPLLVALVVGAWLRLDQLLRQIPADDEWHALQAVRDHDFAWIFTHFGFSDHCIPLTLYDELLANTIGVGELGLRLPMLLAGLASVVVLPLLVRPLVGVRASNGFALLLAISPLLVYFSRYARPYAPATLAACVALVAAWRWRAEGGRAWAATYAASAVLGTWLLPVYGPLVLAPWAFLFVESLARRARGPHTTGSVLLLGLALAVPLLTLLAPPLLNDLDSLTGKISGGEPIHWLVVLQVADLFTGTGDARLRWVVLALALAGALLTARRSPSLVGYLALVFGVQLAALLVANPVMIHSSITLARYLLPLQPVLLLGVAVALGSCDTWLGRGRLPASLTLSALALSAALFAGGPLPSLLERPNSFTNHAWHQYGYDGALKAGLVRMWGRRKPDLPAFFGELAERDPGSLRVLEAPWFTPWHRVKLRESQALHRQHVSVGFVGRGLNPGHELPLGEEFRFRSFVDVGDHDEVVRRGFDYVVFHNNLKRELKHNDHLRFFRLDEHYAEYEQRFGPPVFADRRLTVFAVR